MLQLSLCNPFSPAPHNEYVHLEDLAEEGHRQSTLNSIMRVKVNDSAQWSEAARLPQIKSGCHSCQCRVPAARQRRDKVLPLRGRAGPARPHCPAPPRPLMGSGSREAGLDGARGACALLVLPWGARGQRCHLGKGHGTISTRLLLCRRNPKLQLCSTPWSSESHTGLGWRAHRGSPAPTALLIPELLAQRCAQTAAPSTARVPHGWLWGTVPPPAMPGPSTS